MWDFMLYLEYAKDLFITSLNSCTRDVKVKIFNNVDFDWSWLEFCVKREGRPGLLIDGNILQGLCTNFFFKTSTRHEP